ncbi:MAG: sigma 54-interacting transcriptional regulator [Maledivibacter sp.]|jgi:PAS domain S-box-containing protein|nr:sigma 54-interacting transcriptional regulator [Maledivibacter sp.]
MLFLNSTIDIILDNVNDAVCIVDRDCIVRFWNEKAEEIYEVNRQHVVGKHINNLFPTALLPKVIKEKRPYVNVYNSPREDSHNIITARPLYSGSELIGAISCDRDITELIRLTTILDKTKFDLKVLEEEVTALNENRFSFDQIVGENIKFKEIINLCKNVSKSKINMIITGESGTGKEVFARAIHIESRRKGHFIPINCSAIPEDLMESELFGYEGGAFTGALRKGKVGKFELAHDGTLFLDEIGDMPLSMQPKILRVLEDGMITRVGGSKSIRVDVRVVAATNKDVKLMMEKGMFRKDLYYRLNSILIALPPLRERKDDIPELVDRFIEQFCITYRCNIPEIPTMVMNMMMNYDWEGNIRELRNIIERIVILVNNNKAKEVDIDFLPRSIIESNKEKIEYKKEAFDLNNIIEKAEKDAILNAMRTSGGNKARAAKLLNIPRSTLYFKLNKYNFNNILTR